MTARFRIFSLSRAASTLAIIGLTATPISAQALRPAPTADTQTQKSFLATPEFSRLVEGKSIVVMTTRGRLYEGYFAVYGNALVRRGPGSSVTVPFEQVALVQKSTFRIRTHGLIGLGIGFTVGALMANEICEGNCGGEPVWLFLGVLGSGIGTGMGARNGAFLNVRNFENDILFDLREPFATRLVSPVFTRFVKGKDVWVTTVDGTTRRGEIAAVTDDGLILTGPQGASLPLNQIETIVEVSHRLRNGVVSGFIGGASVGLLTYLGRCDGGSVCGKKLLGLTAVGAGAGVLIAALMNQQKDFDLLYDSGRKKATVSIAPILSPTRKGMAFSMSWR